MIEFNEYISKYTEASLEDIRKTTTRSGFADDQLQSLINFKERDIGSQREVLLHPLMGSQTKDFLKDGLLMLKLPYLNLSVLYVKIYAGRGFFGDKYTYNIYFDDSVLGETWTPGPVFKSYTLAITSLNNIFRDEGL